MTKFSDGVGGDWLVCQVLGVDEVVNSCRNYEDAQRRADELAKASPQRTVTIYKAAEKLIAEVSVVSSEKVVLS